MSPRISRTAAVAAGAALVAASLSSLHAQGSIRAVRVAAGLVNPDFACAPAGDFGRLFIVEQAAGSTGNIRILDLSQDPPVLQPAPYLTITPIQAPGNEEGLLGLAFHPNFAANGYFFVYYTNTSGDNQVVRYQANAPYSTSATANAASARPVMTIAHPIYGNHNGGWIGFGPDGYLYIDTGDGGSANDAPNNAQNLNLRLGKQMRIDIDGDDYPTDLANNYAIPPSNPYYGSSSALPEIWHYGLRNPWRASFDRETGEMWIGDVGQGAIEEIDFVPAGLGGLNFGWRCMEGQNCTGLGGCVCNAPTLTAPVHDYPHTSGNCSVIGGYRYRGSALCNFRGLYFFGDWCTSKVWTLEWNGTSVQNLTDRSAELAGGGGPPISLLTSFGEDARGEIYICDMAGDVYRIEPGSIQDCNHNGLDDGCDLAYGTSHDWNADGVPDECQPTGSSSCFGDGTTPTACPCGNPGAPGRGCDNSSGTGGARLEAFGDPALDSVLLVSTGELPNSMTLFLQGDQRNMNGIVFGSGVRCATGLLLRLYARAANGGTAWVPVPGDDSITVRSTALGDPLAPLTGERRYYQAWYRDPRPGLCAPPGGDTWNMSSMQTIVW